MGLDYPEYEMVDRQFIENQLVPSESPAYLHYEEIFNHAADNVATMWMLVEGAVCTADPLNVPCSETGIWIPGVTGTAGLYTGKIIHSRGQHELSKM